MKKKVELKSLREKVEALLESRITTKNALFEAVPVLVRFQDAVQSFGKLITDCRKLKDELGEACSKYALEHPKAVELSEIREGVASGDIEVDGTKYHLSVGPGEIKRANGDHFVKSFLESLPKEFVKTELKLNPKNIGEESLEEYGLERSPKCTWSEVETAGSAEDVE